MCIHIPLKRLDETDDLDSSFYSQSDGRWIEGSQSIEGFRLIDEYKGIYRLDISLRRSSSDFEQGVDKERADNWWNHSTSLCYTFARRVWLRILDIPIMQLVRLARGQCHARREHFFFWTVTIVNAFHGQWYTHIFVCYFDWTTTSNSSWGVHLFIFS